jgi:sarcosine oxidase, subunit gamma
MFDTIVERHSPLGGNPILALRGVVRVEAAPPLSRFICRGAEAAALCGAPFAIELPQAACRAVVSGERAALWLGPDEWLLVAPEVERQQLWAEMTRVLAANAYSLVDVSHRQIGLELTGPRVAQLINAGCPLDLELSSFPVNMCSRTVFAKTEIVLWRKARDVFHIEVWRSFAPYVAALLNEASLSVTNP